MDDRAPARLNADRCPRCHGALRGRVCGVCGEWPLVDGFPCFVDEAAVSRQDRVFRGIYDWAGWGHDAFVAVSFPVLLRQRAATARARILDAVAVEPGLDVLEVGAGSGGNAAQLASRRPRRQVAVDLSPGMLRRLRRRNLPGLELGLVDAHALPFADASFDRVVQVGAVCAFGDPARAIAEMVRVCRPGGRVVLVDEALSGDVGLFRRVVFRALTVYEAAPHAPVELLPALARGVVVEPLNDYFFLLSFTVGDGPAPPRAPPGSPRGP